MTTSTFRIWYITLVISACLYSLIYLKYKYADAFFLNTQTNSSSLKAKEVHHEPKRNCQDIRKSSTAVAQKTRKFKILWYNPLHGGLYPEAERVDFSDCPYKNCVMKRVDVKKSGVVPGKTILDADAILFDGSKLATSSPPKRRNKDQVFVFVDIEPPVMHHTDMYKNNHWDGVFNWTMTYRMDSDILYSYGKLERRNFRNSVKQYESMFYKKSNKVLWLVSSCQSTSNRSKYVNKLKKYLDIDVFGACSPHRKMICKEDNMDECLAGFVKKPYKLYLSLENSFCKDYLSEKVYRWYDKDVVPVIRGTATKGKLLPKGTFIDTDDFSSVEKLGIYLQKVMHNETLFTSFLREKDNYYLYKRQHMAQMGYCNICKRLNHLNCYRKSYKSITKWWYTKACRKPTDLE